MRIKSSASRCGSAVCAVLVAVATSLVATPALAHTATAPDVLTAAEEQQLFDFFEQYGVDSTIQETLVARVDQGLPLDSYGGVEPVSTVEEVSGHEARTVATYPDGSIGVTTLSLAHAPTAGDGQIAPMWVDHCVYTGGNAYEKHYANCQAGHTVGFVTLKFDFDYTKWNGGARIDAVRNGYHLIIGSTVTGESLQITRATSTGALAATARYTVNVSGLLPTGGTVWLQVNAKGAPYTTHVY